MVKKKRLVKFSAVKTTKKPVKVTFKTKSGKTISFKAIKVVKKKKTVRFRAKK